MCDNIENCEIDHSYTTEIVCPYCGEEWINSDEHIDDDGEEIECYNCDNTFHLEVIKTIEYTTSKICKCETCGSKIVESTSFYPLCWDCWSKINKDVVEKYKANLENK